MDNRCISESKISEVTFNDSGTYARLRRLKIQEEILTAAAKSLRKCNTDESISFRYSEQVDLKNYVAKIKKTYAEIKNLFEDIKIITKNQENLKNTDVDEIKRDILELDEKIKNLKDFIFKETSVLRTAEKELLIKIHENHDRKLRYITRTHSKPNYNEVVPSPVRAIIKSPFKCVEVQRFQEFMKNSCNRYGGWDEYNHNIFVGIWNKHFNSDEIIQKASVLEETCYPQFQDEVMQKIFGIRVEDIKPHVDWYFQYIHLKKCQEFALNKWKENKRKIKKPKQIAKGDNLQFTRVDKNSMSNVDNRNTNSKGHRDRGRNAEKLVSELNIRGDDTDVLDVKYIMEKDYDRKGFKRVCSKKEGLISILDTQTMVGNGFHTRTATQSANNTGLFIDSVKKLKTPMWRIDLK